MTRAAPRIPQRLLDAIERRDDGRAPLAEIVRRVGEDADRLGISRPSYERIRQLIHEQRAIRSRGPGDLQVLAEAMLGARSLVEANAQLSVAPERRRRLA